MLHFLNISVGWYKYAVLITRKFIKSEFSLYIFLDIIKHLIELCVFLSINIKINRLIYRYKVKSDSYQIYKEHFKLFNHILKPSIDPQWVFL